MTTDTPSVIINGISLSNAHIEALRMAVWISLKKLSLIETHLDVQYRERALADRAYLTEIFTLLKFTQDIEILGDAE
jgi:hypothetical protein